MFKASSLVTRFFENGINYKSYHFSKNCTDEKCNCDPTTMQDFYIDPESGDKIYPNKDKYGLKN